MIGKKRRADPSPRRLGVYQLGLLFLLPLGLGACGESVYDTIELMPPPAVYVAGEVDPFPKVTEQTYAEQAVLFYATDRRPATEEDAGAFYANERGFFYVAVRSQCVLIHRLAVGKRSVPQA